MAARVVDIAMRESAAEIEKMPDGPEKEQARKMLADMRADKNLTAAFAKECEEQAYSQACFKCVMDAQDMTSLEACEAVCEAHE
jgi:hypothetical protein